jgi:hypothetical protein
VAKEKHNKEKERFRDGNERGQMILVKNVKFNNTTSGGDPRNINCNERTILCKDKKKSVENFEREYLWIRR